jgi:UDP-glucose 4-epimerase
MRTLVTGGAGFIGAHLVNALAARGDDVTVLDNMRRPSTTPLPPGTKTIEGDIRDTAAVARVAEGRDVVFHLAAQSNVLGALTDIDYSFSTNVTGTFNVLQAAANAGVRKVVFASSREVYGEQRLVPVSENACTSAKNPYGASKVAGEAYCRTWAAVSPLECSVLRFANVYGPGDRDRVIPLWLGRAARGEELLVYGGQQVLDFVHIDMAVAALLRAADVSLPGPVNVGSGVGTPILGLAERIRTVTGRNVPLTVEPARDAEVTRFVAGTERMRSLLGIEPPADPLYGLAALSTGLPAARTEAVERVPRANAQHSAPDKTKRGAGPQRRVFVEEARGQLAY